MKLFVKFFVIIEAFTCGIHAIEVSNTIKDAENINTKPIVRYNTKQSPQNNIGSNKTAIIEKSYFDITNSTEKTNVPSKSNKSRDFSSIQTLSKTSTELQPKGKSENTDPASSQEINEKTNQKRGLYAKETKIENKTNQSEDTKMFRSVQNTKTNDINTNVNSSTNNQQTLTSEEEGLEEQIVDLLKELKILRLKLKIKNKSPILNETKLMNLRQNSLEENQFMPKEMQPNSVDNQPKSEINQPSRVNNQSTGANNQSTGENNKPIEESNQPIEENNQPIGKNNQSIEEKNNQTDSKGNQHSQINPTHVKLDLKEIQQISKQNPEVLNYIDLQSKIVPSAANIIRYSSNQSLRSSSKRKEEVNYILEKIKRVQRELYEQIINQNDEYQHPNEDELETHPQKKSYQYDQPEELERDSFHSESSEYDTNDDFLQKEDKSDLNNNYKENFGYKSPSTEIPNDMLRNDLQYLRYPDNVELGNELNNVHKKIDQNEFNEIILNELEEIWKEIGIKRPSLVLFDELQTLKELIDNSTIDASNKILQQAVQIKSIKKYLQQLTQRIFQERGVIDSETEDEENENTYGKKASLNNDPYYYDSLDFLQKQIKSLRQLILFQADLINDITTLLKKKIKHSRFTTEEYSRMLKYNHCIEISELPNDIPAIDKFLLAINNERNCYENKVSEFYNNKPSVKQKENNKNLFLLKFGTAPSRPAKKMPSYMSG